ncbi:hypothetical protein [Salipaludibacillus sp. CF4.18]|uniref:hypothetical protein n=1 Tax=Salipaludibacillus sp. CF4.18 TaxID=3373081 RepID=UPI003EE6D9EE
MEVTTDHIQGLFTGAIIPILLFVILHYFIDKGKLNINKKEYYIRAYESDGGGGYIETEFSKRENAFVKIKLTLKLLLSNSGKRKLSINTFQIESDKLDQPIILTADIVELDVGVSKPVSLEILVSYYEANIIIDNNSTLVTVDNKGNKKKIKLGEATT